MSTTTFAPSAPLRKALNWTIALSVVMIVAGILAILVPPIAGIATTIFFAWMLIISGVLHFVYAWHTRGTGGMFWELLLGAVYLFVGFYTVLHPLLGLVSLTLVLGAYLLVEAVLEFILAVRLRPVAGSGWMFFDSLITLILAILIWRGWPASSIWVIGVLVGVSMLLSGVTRLMVSLAARRVVNQIP
jgi:uncharacterized membrane protein HdeD (DUF308 family)